MAGCVIKNKDLKNFAGKKMPRFMEGGLTGAKSTRLGEAGFKRVPPREVERESTCVLVN